MGVNHFEYFGSTKFDLRSDTVTEAALLSGVTAHNAAGNQITGTLSMQKIFTGTSTPTTSIGDDGDIYLHMINSSSKELYPVDVTASGMNSTGHLSDCIGVSADDGTSSSNVYSSGSGTTGIADYTFDFSNIPNGASIDNVSLQVKAHEENSSRSECTIRVYSGSTVKGSLTTVSGTSNHIYDVDCGSSWTRSELDNFIMRLSLGYYGGLIAGATLTVDYSFDEASFSVALNGTSTDWSIAGDDIYKKANGSWSKVSSVVLSSGVAKQ